MGEGGVISQVARGNEGGTNKYKGRGTETGARESSQVVVLGSPPAAPHLLLNLTVFRHRFRTTNTNKRSLLKTPNHRSGFKDSPQLFFPPPSVFIIAKSTPYNS